MGDVSIGPSSSTTTAFNPYKFSAYLNSAQSSSNGTSKVLLDTITFDSNGNFDAVTNHRYTAPVAGYYQFNWCVYSNNSAPTGFWIAILEKNSAAINDGSEGGLVAYSGSSGSALVQLAATDFVELFIQSGGITAINNAATSTYLHGFLVSRA